MSSLLLLCLAGVVLALVGWLGDRLDRRAKTRWERRDPVLLVLLALGGLWASPARANAAMLTCPSSCLRGFCYSICTGEPTSVAARTCDPLTLAAMVRDVIANLPLQNALPPTSMPLIDEAPLTPAQRLRQEADALEAHDALLAKARQLVHDCAPQKEP